MTPSPIYQTIFNNTGTATVIIEADTTISLANTEFEKLSGFSKKEIEGKLQWTIFVHEDDLPRMKEYHYKRREDPASVPRNYEFRVRNRSGDILNVVITIEMIPGTSQSVASLVDITEILEMRKTLEHRLRFEKILTRISGNFINLPREKIDDGVTDALRAIGEFKEADRSYLFLIGPDGIHWSNTHEWCAPGVKPEKETLQQQLITDASWTFQQLLDNKNINISSIAEVPGEAEFERKLFSRQQIKALAIVPLYYEKNLRGFLGLDSVSKEKQWEENDFAMLRTVGDAIVNAVERKHFEEELERSEKNYRDFVDFLPQVVFEAELDGTLTFANQYAFELFNYSKEDLRKGTSIFSMIEESEWERAKENVRYVFEGAESTGNEYTGISKDGRKFPILLYSAPVFAGGGIRGLRGIIIDITVRKQLEEQLRQSQKMEAIGRLAGGIAHDFNNMLSSIMGFSSILRLDEKLRGESREAVESMMDVAKSGANLTRQLLSFSRKEIVSPRDLAINSVIDKAVKMLRRLIRGPITLETELEKSLWNIEADPGQIEQIVINLVLNSQDALPEGGRIAITTKNLPGEAAAELGPRDLSSVDYVVLEVIDNGRGMTEDIQQKVFEPFFTTKEQGRGTGLGLSTVYGIALQNGGAVDIESKPEKGTTISVFWPRAAE
jgi:two-component system, cell cycle sensor histidine kinase and response regulator CckA